MKKIIVLIACLSVLGTASNASAITLKFVAPALGVGAGSGPITIPSPLPPSNPTPTPTPIRTPTPKPQPVYPGVPADPIEAVGGGCAPGAYCIPVAN